MKYLSFSRKAPTSEEIAAVEELVGRKADPSFIDFLQENNGGIPLRPFFGDFHVQVLYPLCTDREPNILQQTENVGLDPGLAVFGREGRGHRLIVDFSTGRIYCDIDLETPIADSILTFAEGLEGEEEDEVDELSELVSLGDVEMLREWVKQGNSINSTNSEGRTPIQIAALRHDIPTMKACLDMGASVEGVESALRQVASFTFLEDLRDQGILP